MPFAGPLDVGPEGIVGACIESIVSGRPIIRLKETAKIYEDLSWRRTGVMVKTRRRCWLVDVVGYLMTKSFLKKSSGGVDL
jgi:hypothetical protein